MKTRNFFHIAKLYPVLILFCASAVIAGYIYIRLEKKELQKNHESLLSSVSKLKTNDITRWLNESFEDIENISNDKLFRKTVANYLNNNCDLTSFSDKLDFYKLNDDYDEIFIVDSCGKTIYPNSVKFDAINDINKSAFVKVKKYAAIEVCEFYRCSKCSNIHFDVIAPILSLEQKKPIGAVVLRIDPNRFLFPMIQEWPTPSKSSETVLFRRDGNEVLYLNKLRHSNLEALSNRFSLEDSEQISVMAINGKRGIVKGVDYRGIEVIAEVNKIPGTNWFILSKTDKSEVFESIQKQGWIVYGAIFVLLILCIGIILYLYSKKDAAHYKNLYTLENINSSLKTKYEYLITYANDLMILMNIDGLIIEANKKAQDVLGINTEDYNRSHFIEFQKSDDILAYINSPEGIADKGLMLHTEVKCRSGEVIFAEINICKINFESTNYYYLIIRDVSERISSQRSIYNSERKLQSIINAIPNPLFYKNPQGIYEMCNTAFAAFMRLPKDQILNRSDYELSPKELADEYHNSDRELLQQKTMQVYEANVICKDDSAHPVMLYKSTVENISGETEGIVGVMLDLKKQKDTENIIRESEEHYRELFENANDIVFSIDFEGYYTSYNAVSARMMEIEPYNGEKKYNIKQFLCAAEYEKALSMIKKKVMGDQFHTIYEINIQSITGKKYIVEINSALRFKNGKPFEIFAIARNIEERKEAENRLRASEERFRTMFKQAPLGIALIDSYTGKIYEANPMFAKIAGRTIAELEDIDWMSITHPDDVQEDLDNMALLNAGKITEFQLEKRYLHPDGTPIWITMAIAPIMVADNESKRHLCMIENISDRKMTDFLILENKHLLEDQNRDLEIAQMRAEESEKQFMDVLYASHDAILLIDSEKFVDCNEATALMLGYENREDFLMTHPSELSPELQPDGLSSFDKANEMMKTALAKGFHRFEWMYKKANGEVFPVEVSLTPIASRGKTIIHCVWDDITDRKQMDAKLKMNYEKQHVLNSILQLSVEKTTISELLEKALKIIASISWLKAVNRGSIFLTKNNESLELLAQQNMPKKMSEICHNFPFGKCHCGKASLMNEIAYSYCLRPPGAEGLDAAHEFGHYAVPMMFNEKMIGVINTYVPAGHNYSEDEFSFITMIANTLSSVIARKEVEEQIIESEEKFRSITSTALDAIAMLDDAGNVVLWNKAAEKIFGYTSEEIIGNNFQKLLLTDTFSSSDERMLQTFFKTGRSPIIGKTNNLDMIRKDGIEVPTELSVSGVQMNGRWFLIGIIRDISVQIEVNKAITLAKEVAENASRSKSQFLANISHEIRTPLNGVIGMTELTLTTPLNDTQRDYIDSVQYSAYSLLDIINDILDFSKIEAGKLHIESIPFDLISTVEKTVDMLAVKAQEKKLELICDIDYSIPESLIGDSLRIRQILINLIGNAIKFTNKGEVIISVKMEKTIKECMFLRFTVKDSGIGIPAKKQKLIFESFSQADSTTTREYGGTGLGLTISKCLTELMGGSIHVESAVGKGSSFNFILPLKINSEKPVFRAKSEDLSLLKNVLIVDDNSTNIRILSDMLTYMNVPSTHAESGKEALNIIKKMNEEGNNFDLIILDIQMPYMNGLTVAEKIRFDLKLSYNPIFLMFSSVDRDSMQDRAVELGIQAYLMKPVKLQELKDALIRVVAGSSITPFANKQKAKPLTKSRKVKLLTPILIAEDNLINMKILSDVLANGGYQYLQASNGKEALALYIKHKPEFVMMDMHMPEMDGFQATKAIRKFENENSIKPCKIIALTAMAMQGDKEKCLQAGMNDYISKPFKKEEVMNTIEKQFQIAKNEMPNSKQSEIPINLNGQEVLNKEELLKRVDNNLEFMNELLQDFCRILPENVNSLISEIASNNKQMIVYHAHTIKGMCVSMSAKRVKMVAEKMEKEASNGCDYMMLKNLSKQLIPEMEKVIKAIKVCA